MVTPVNMSQKANFFLSIFIGPANTAGYESCDRSAWRDARSPAANDIVVAVVTGNRRTARSYRNTSNYLRAAVYWYSANWQTPSMWKRS